MKRILFFLIYTTLCISAFGKSQRLYLNQLVDSPCEVTANLIEKILEEEQIRLKISYFQPLSISSSKWTFEINTNWIIQFYTHQKQCIDTENSLLHLIDGKVSALTPHIEHVGQVYYFALYRKILGIPLNDIEFTCLTQQEQDTLAQSIATFLVTLQSAITFKEAKAIALPLESEQYLNETFPRVPDPDALNEALSCLLPLNDPDLTILWNYVYAHYKKIIDDPMLMQLTHNDLHAGNLLIDPNTKQLIGVIDFSEANWGHVYREFRHFYSLSPELMEKIATCYAQMQHLDVDSVIKYAYIFRLYRDFTNLWKVYTRPDICSNGDFLSEETLRMFITVNW